MPKSQYLPEVPSIATRSSRLVGVAIALILLTIAVVLRIAQLDALGFYGDEDTTALPSLAAANGEGTVMPSGMGYHRALPHSIANGFVARSLGGDHESNYRLVSAMTGVVTIGLFWLLLYRTLGPTAAVIGAAMLVTSEWHVLVSREARMYAPFLMAQCGFLAFFVRWYSSGKLIALAASLGFAVLMISLHKLAVVLALFPVLLVATWPVSSNRQTICWIASVTIAIGGLAYSEIFVESQFTNWQARFTLPERAVSAADGTPVLALLNEAIRHPLIALMTLAFAATATWMATHRGNLNLSSQSKLLTTNLAVVLLTFATLFFTAAGQVYGAILTGLMLLVILQQTVLEFAQRNRILTTIVLLGNFAHLSVALTNYGLAGLKGAASAPYPTMLSMTSQVVVLTLFGTCCALLTTTRVAINAPPIVRTSIVITLTITCMLGLIQEWVALRYLIVIYPFVLIPAAFVIWLGINSVIQFFRLSWSAMLLGTVAVLAWPAGEIGLRAAWAATTIKYGEATPSFLFSAYPDHQLPGRYVAENRKDGDLVIAEDAIVQTWYAGKVDYWFRSPEIDVAFHVIDGDGERRDIYTNSKIATTSTARTLETYCDGKVFLITSGETATGRKYYIDQDQIEWVTTIERTQAPLIEGRDGMSAVYCINCQHLKSDCTDGR